jgi:hypothetical protein
MRWLAASAWPSMQCASVRTRKNYAGSSPITRASRRSKIVLARFVRNDRLADALQSQALSALTGSPGARTYYDKQPPGRITTRRDTPHTLQLDT